MAELTDDQLRAIDARLTADVRSALTLTASLQVRDIEGGTVPQRVHEQIATLRIRLKPVGEWAARYAGPRSELAGM